MLFENPFLFSTSLKQARSSAAVMWPIIEMCAPVAFDGEPGNGGQSFTVGEDFATFRLRGMCRLGLI